MCWTSAPCHLKKVMNQLSLVILCNSYFKVTTKLLSSITISSNKSLAWSLQHAVVHCCHHFITSLSRGTTAFHTSVVPPLFLPRSAPQRHIRGGLTSTHPGSLCPYRSLNSWQKVKKFKDVSTCLEGGLVSTGGKNIWFCRTLVSLYPGYKQFQDIL